MSEDTQGEKGSLLSTIKWVCIAIVVLTLAFMGYKAYRVVAAPVEAVGNAAESVTGAVKSGAGAVSDKTSDIYNRLDIAAPNQRRLNRAAEAAFASLTQLPETESEGVKVGVMRMRHLSGSNGQVCALNMDFGAGDIPVYVAADNDAYATSKELGSTDDRLIRMVILTDKDDVALNTGWNAAQKGWQMKWKATTVKKEMSDDVAAQRILDILKNVKSGCTASQ